MLAERVEHLLACLASDAPVTGDVPDYLAQTGKQRISLGYVAQPLAVAVVVVIYDLGVRLAPTDKVRQKAATPEKVNEHGAVGILPQHLCKLSGKASLLSHKGKRRG